MRTASGKSLPISASRGSRPPKLSTDRKSVGAVGSHTAQPRGRGRFRRDRVVMERLLSIGRARRVAGGFAAGGFLKQLLYR